MVNKLLIIISLLVLGIIIIGLIIFFIHKSKKSKEKEELIMPRLNEWVKNAREVGMNYTQIRTKLEINGWNTKYVQKALKNNGLIKPEGYK